MEYAYLNSPVGLLKIEGDVDGLSAVIYTDEKAPDTTIIPECLEDVVYQLKEYFEGKKVWIELQSIAFGKTASYLDMAKQLGDPKVIRAAASANGKNPISIIIPCHRVIANWVCRRITSEKMVVGP